MVLVGIFFAATGRGGELAYEQADHAPLDLGPVSAADIALLRPPTAMWGYNMQVTDAALDQIARAMRERDVTIAYLQDQLAGYERNGSYPDYPDYSGYAEPRGAHARQARNDVEFADRKSIRGPPGQVLSLSRHLREKGLIEGGKQVPVARPPVRQRPACKRDAGEAPEKARVEIW